MASNFYEAGLEHLVKQYWSTFNEIEKAVLDWLYKASQGGIERYQEEVSKAQFGTIEFIYIESIKAKCRQLGLRDHFERLQAQYAENV